MLQPPYPLVAAIFFHNRFFCLFAQRKYHARDVFPPTKKFDTFFWFCYSLNAKSQAAVYLCTKGGDGNNASARKVFSTEGKKDERADGIYRGDDHVRNDGVHPGG
jgi:hypothetical protein